jgi:hypothetical protein
MARAQLYPPELYRSFGSPSVWAADLRAIVTLIGALRAPRNSKGAPPKNAHELELGSAAKLQIRSGQALHAQPAFYDSAAAAANYTQTAKLGGRKRARRTRAA